MIVPRPDGSICDDAYACPEEPLHPSVVEAGQALAHDGDIDGALAILRRAVELEPDLGIDPEQEVQHFAALGLIDEGRALARAGNVEAAIVKFESALEHDPDVDLDPEGEARHLAAQGLIENGKRLVKEGAVQDAVVAYTRARTLDPDLDISAGDLNYACWFGSLWGHAADVIDFCEQAGELAPDHGWYRDSRGVARALTGNYAGAIEDFTFFIEWSKANGHYEKYGARREPWIAELEAGRNPLDDEVMESLWNE